VAAFSAFKLAEIDSRLLGCRGGSLFAEHDALDVVGTACRSVAGDKRGAHLRIAFGGFELAGHSGEETLENLLDFNADDGVVGAGHAYIGLVGGASGKDAFVGSGDVGVGAKEGGDAAVKIPAQGDLLAGGFAVQVEEDDPGSGFGCDLGEEVVGLAEGIVAGGHEDAALQVHYGVGLAGREFALVEAKARGADGVVGGAKDAAATDVRARRNSHVLEDLLLVPDVIAGGDDVRTEVKELFRDGGRDAEAASRVFAIDDQ